MGIIGNFLGDQAGNIGEFVDKNIFGGSGKTGRSVGSASSSLLRLLPFEKGGYVTVMPTARTPLTVKVPIMASINGTTLATKLPRALEKGGMVKRKKGKGKKKM